MFLLFPKPDGPSRKERPVAGPDQFRGRLLDQGRHRSARRQPVFRRINFEFLERKEKARLQPHPPGRLRGLRRPSGRQLRR